MKRSLLVIFLLAGTILNSQIVNLFVNSYDNIVKLNFQGGGTPTANLTGVGNGYEGIAHAEDGLGNILFFVNASGVYRGSNNSLMPGSVGILANPSAAEIVICPNPANSNQYYIIYNAETCTSLYYSIVDMTLLGGTGDVINLNTTLDPASFSEGLEIIKVPCQNEYWLLAYQCFSYFKAFKINSSGIQAGTNIMNYAGPTGSYDGRGELDFNNGKFGIAFGWNNQGFVADFDPVTGLAANPNPLSLPLSITTGNGLYGIEFSPDASKVYLSAWYTATGDNLFQFDLSNSNAMQSYALTSTNGPNPQGGETGPGQIELGPDGNLYIVHNSGNQIHVITNSNTTTPVFSSITANFTGALGISDHIQSEVYSVAANFIFTAPCVGDSVNFTGMYSGDCNGSGNESYAWTFGDPPSASNNVSTLQDPAHLYPAAGSYTVTLIITDSIYADTIVKVVSVSSPVAVNLGNDTTLCSGTNIMLSSNVGSIPVTWNNGSTAPNIIVPAPGTYWVTAQNGNCSSSDTIHVYTSTAIIPNVLNVTACAGTTITLSAGVNAPDYLWSTGDTTQTISVTSSGSYTVTTANNGCFGSDVGTATFVNAPSVNLGGDLTFCDYVAFVLDAQNPGSSYSWSNSVTTQTDSVILPGVYSVTVTNSGGGVSCSDADTVMLTLVDANSHFILPNIFTPNGDNKNDLYDLNVGTAVSKFDLKIFDRWGKLVYESDSPQKRWDGKGKDEGVYYAILIYEDPCQQGKSVTLTNYLHLMR